MRTIVVEDEDLTRKMIVNYVKSNPNLQFIGEAASVQESVVLINACQPDLLLVDIQLKDGLSFEILEKIITPVCTIFITAYQEYAIKALKLGAIDYILKPIDFEELSQAIDKTKSKIPAEQLEETQNHLVGKGSKIILKTIEGLYIVHFEDILYCQSNGAYTLFYLKEEKSIMTSKNIKEYESILPVNFIRCHNSFIVNINQISNITKDNELELRNGQKIAVSSRKKDDLIELLSK